MYRHAACFIFLYLQRVSSLFLFDYTKLSPPVPATKSQEA